MAIVETNHKIGTLEHLVNEWPIGQELTASEIYRYTLEMLGVEMIGVYIGGRCIDLIDKIGQSKKIQLRVGTSESDLGHAMQAYFKVTRKPGLLIVTSGPGGTNSATPVKDAHSDSDALIVTVGQVPNEVMEVEDEPFQGAVMVEPFSYWSKWTHRIKDPDEVQSVLKTAYYLSKNGRPGPIVIEFPSPIAQFQKAKLKHLDEVPLIDVQLKKPEVYRRVEVKTTNLDNLVEAVKVSQRPVGVGGGGVYNAGAAEELIQTVERADMPLETTLILLGGVRKHRLNLGLPGMHGPIENNLAIYNSDLVVYVGGRLDDRIIGDPKKFAPDAKIFWIEPNYPGISTVMAQRVQKIEMDAKKALHYLLEKLPQLTHERWLNQIYAWREKYPMPTHVPRKVIQQIREFVKIYEPKEPYITTGVGAHQMFLAEFWDFDPELGMKMLLTSGGLGVMGTGMPFAVGAGFADPSRQVYIFNGDGSAIMDQRAKLMAWQLARDGQYPGVKEIIFRDNSLGMVDFWQDEFWEQRKTATAIEAPDEYFKHIALASQFKYFVVDYRNGNTGSNRAISEDFVKYRGNALLEVKMLPQSVRPMIPAAKSALEMKLPNGMKLDPTDLLVGKNW
ncbi:hypothetical protein HYX04_04800 [Candidatus Woesearchaeota archaeon]|nr:hypothetical protein [Candidatus Woesearchaeota archaeon]